MAKKKLPGHYCRICGERKSNESFTGKGHAKHICKECDALPQERKNELQALNRLASAGMKYPRTRQDWDLLEKYAKSNKYPEAQDFARSMLGRDKPEATSDDNADELIQNIDSIHTTEMGAQRIKRNLGLTWHDPVLWCKQRIEQAENIVRKGKNWYVHVNNAVITINAHSYTIITAHKDKSQPKITGL